MKEYLLIFRTPMKENMQPPSPEEMTSSMEDWKNWMGGLAQNGKFTAGQPLTMDGKMMRTQTNITDGPFVEGKEIVNGYLLIKAADYNEAVELSKGCPIFKDKGSVEVREIAIMNM